MKFSIKKMKFSNEDFVSKMWLIPPFPADFVTFAEGILNPFVPNAPFLHPWKHQETLRFTVFWRFQGVEVI